MLHGLFFISDTGEVLLRKDFLYSSVKWSPDVFAQHFKKNMVNLCTSVRLDNMFYFHMKTDNILLVAVTSIAQMSAVVILAYLDSLSDLLKDLLGTLTPHSIFTNIGLVYELICESTNAGFPRLINKEKMRTLLCNSVSVAKPGSKDFLSILPDNLFGAVGDGEKRVASSDATKKPVKLKAREEQHKQELFVDLIEKLSVIIDSRGGVMHYGIEGKIQVKSYLDCAANVSVSFAQNASTAEIFSSARCHSTVDVTKLPAELKVPVHPGTLTAIQYKASCRDDASSLPFTVYTNVVPVVGDKLVMLNLKLHSSLPARNPAVNFVGTIPLPHSTVTSSGSSSLANMEFAYDRHTQTLRFTSPMYPGESHHSISVKVLVKQWTPAMVYELNQVALEFEAPMYCQSGLRISNLKVESTNSANDRSSQAVNRWVRYITHSKSYEIYLKDDWLS